MAPNLQPSGTPIPAEYPPREPSVGDEGGARWRSELVKLAHTDLSLNTLWPTRAASELSVARVLEQKAGGTVRFLHKRAVQGSTTSIDHIAVTPSGVWVFAIKSWAGKVRRVGGPLHREVRLYVAKRDLTPAVERINWQTAVVLNALVGSIDDVVARPALCLTGSGWPLFSRPMTLGEMVVASPSKLAWALRTPGAWRGDKIEDVARRLEEILPARP
jgi:hypothetical protein